MRVYSIWIACHIIEYGIFKSQTEVKMIIFANIVNFKLARIKPK